MKSSLFKVFLLFSLGCFSGILCFTSEDCHHINFDENELSSLEFFEICGRNRVYDNECPSNNCSCSIDTFHDRTSFEKFSAVYNNSTRRSLVKEKIRLIIGAPHKNRLITVMVLNKGYVAFFLNWLCSLGKHGITMKPQDLLLFIDRGTSVIFSQLHLPYKYLVLEDDWYLDDYVISNATGGFDTVGDFNGLPNPFDVLTRFKIFVQLDLIELGHDYILNDIDIAWKSDPRVWLLKGHYKRGMHFDVEISYDGRRDILGPGNTGFYVVYNTCRTRLLYDVMFRHMWLLWQSNDDQLWMNTWLGRSKLAFYMRPRLLPTAQFVNGNLLGTDDPPFAYHTDEEYGLFHRFYLDSSHNPADMLIVHASWTGSFKTKIAKLKGVGLWHYEPDLCSAYYLREVDPRRDLSHAYFRYNNSVYTHNNYSLTPPTSLVSI